jgi:uncharacterized protein YndB with AHSA1/START domain
MTTPPNALTLERDFSAPRERLFHIWTTPEYVCQWIGGGNFVSPNVEIDLRVGGSYRIELVPPDSDRFWVVGEFREVQAPERLVYTWVFEGTEGQTGETLVTVEFRDLGGSTRVTIQHELFASPQLRDAHQAGWAACFDQVGALV